MTLLSTMITNTISNTTSISTITMSADNTNQASEVTKKTKTATLSEKYNKFIQFGYYMMSQMSNQESFNREEYMEQLRMFANVEEQQSFVQTFFDNQKQIKKDMALLKKNKNKKPDTEKPKRTTKSKGKAKQTQSESSPVAGAPAVVEETQENLIETITNELSEEPMISQINSAIEVAKELTAKKPRVVKKKTNPKTKTSDVDQLASELAAVAM
jgi:hypothetical protein